MEVSLISKEPSYGCPLSQNSGGLVPLQRTLTQGMHKSPFYVEFLPITIPIRHATFRRLNGLKLLPKRSCLTVHIYPLRPAPIKQGAPPTKQISLFRGIESRTRPIYDLGCLWSKCTTQEKSLGPSNMCSQGWVKQGQGLSLVGLPMQSYFH